MIDTLSPLERSLRMARIRAKNTRPELLVRHVLFAAGYRYRLHDAKLPGKPDIVFGRRRKVIFINGCFWHHHNKCALARIPKSNREFWIAKLLANKARDQKNWESLNNLGWSVLVVWECEIRDDEFLLARLRHFLGDRRMTRG